MPFRMINVLFFLAATLMFTPAYAENTAEGAEQPEPTAIDVKLPTQVDFPLLVIETPDAHYELDEDTLAALPHHTVATTTIWTDGPQEFVGIPMSALLAILDPEGEMKTVTLLAANNYQIDVPAAHYAEFDATLAFMNHGVPMTLRDKGPLWIVYPFDADPRYRSEIIFANSIWQLEKITLTR